MSHHDRNPFVGSWTYRSLLNDPDGSKAFNDLEFGEGTIVIEDGPPELLTGTIGGPGWSLALHGSRGYGSPAQVRFQGKGLVGGAEWIYDYIGWLVPVWPNSTATLQRPAIVGSVVRTIPHPASGGGVSPAGVVASFYAVKVD
ncbi:hypothetical protein [Chitinimonas koreensis]|uniref:hypothetical protein n=1 Tax=Chitinimonas koreensis TaxID=356302 RepID=UPI000428ECAD|nr:hypothetical protein [Chitinimonas koreensis]QNM98540.1 hypothetical protein H9L41_10100 [Chitinimonas koreensis]